MYLHVSKWIQSSKGDTANTGNNGQNHSGQQNLEKDESEDKLILCRQKHTLQQRERQAQQNVEQKISY